MNNGKTIWHWSSLTLQCLASNCSRPWEHRWYFFHVPNMPCSPHRSNHESSNFVSVEEEKVFLNHNMEGLSFFFFTPHPKGCLADCTKINWKKKSPPKFKQNFSLSSFTRSRASPIVTDHMSLTLLPNGYFWEKSNLRPIPCFYMEKSQPQFFSLKTSVLQVTMPKLHLGIYIAVGVFPPVFTIRPLIVTLRYTVYWGTSTLLQLLLNNCIVKKNSDQMCCERGALRHPSN